MAIEDNSDISSQRERLEHESPRFFSRDELLSSAKKDFATLIAQGKIRVDDIETFIDERVTGIKINGVNVTSIDIDHKPEDLDPLTNAYINSPRTAVVVPEYFYPELDRNAGLLSSRMRKSNNSRFSFAQNLTDTLRESGKPVAVADIANKPTYEMMYGLVRSGPLAVIGGLSAAHSVLPNDTVYTAASVISALASFGLSNFFQETMGKGMFNKDKIARLEQFIPDIEQARRLFLAKGIEQLTTEYPPSAQPGKEIPQIVALYPKAHGIRMADMLVHPHPYLDKAKARVYKAFGPRLDFSVRTYEWKDSLQRLAKSDHQYRRPQVFSDTDSLEGLAGWIKVSDRKIKV